VKVKDKIRATLPEALHDDLHWARNQFLHGMPIRPTMPRYRQSNRYNPTMSRILSMSSGSFDSLKVSLRWGCRPNAADAVDRRPTDPIGFGHVAHAPVGRAARRRFQRANHDPLDLLIGGRAGRARIRPSLLFYFTVY
jgi:hypothetical protein